MKVTFCLPTQNYRSPIGGFKMVYEYANRLVEKGYTVNIVYCIENTFKNYKIPKRIRFFLAHIVVSKSPTWFHLDKRVKRIAAPMLIDKYIPDADIVFATAAQTAEKIKMLSPCKGKKYYFIQDYENWLMNDEELIETYKMGLMNMVVSNWLYDIVHEYAPNNTVCIKNPIDTDLYCIHNPVDQRGKYSIGMLYHSAEHKGCKYAIDAVFKVKKRYNNVELYMFGNPDLPKEYKLDWIHYTQHASTRQTVNLYNRCSIFICASIEEGFGLTGLESMACACAFVSTSYRGVHEYAVNSVNALLSEVKDSNSLANNIIRLIEDESLRNMLSQNALKTAKNFSWNQAMTKFLNILVEGVNHEN